MKIPCICPPKGDAVRHPDGDEITFRDTLGFRPALAIRNDIAVLHDQDGEASVGEILAVLTEGYLLHGIASWTLVDEKGKPVEVSKTAIRHRLLSRPDIAMDVGDEADKLYAEAVMLPLLARAKNSSPPTRTKRPTSATRGKARKRPKPSRRSSITTIPTAGTEVTSSSLAGGSSSSQSSTSAA